MAWLTQDIYFDLVGGGGTLPDRLTLIVLSACQTAMRLSGWVLISVPSLGAYYFVSLTLSVCPTVRACLFVANIASSFFVSRWNRAISWPSVLHDKNYKTIFFDF